MPVIRISKIVLVASIALYASLVALGNITDYGSNFAFVQHVLLMDTIFPDSTLTYRAIANPAMHHAAYVLIIAVEVVTAIACWAGAARMFAGRGALARDFNRTKKWAVIGLTMGFVLWQAGFMTIGGEWFGMWMSSTWNGRESAFRALMTILGVLIYVTMPDGELSDG
jgi:predicted small integral membrane protein